MSTEPQQHPVPVTAPPVTAADDPSAPVPAGPRHRLPAAVRAMRPRQWTKNVLVFTAPLASGQLLEPAVLGRAALAFVAFCLISACVYLVNDIRDVAEDRLHPKKRYRPIAAGELRVPAAWLLAGVCAALGFAIAFWTAVPLGVTVALYLVLQVLYSLFLKHLPIIDLAMVASGFLLRAVAGGVASSIELSQWFLLVASFGSLFMVAGKRYSELVALGVEAGTRKSLERYSESYLRFAWMLAAVMVVVSYSLWAFEQGAGGPWGLNWAALSIAPFTLAMLQYAMEVDTGQAAEPEDIVLRDRVLQVLGLIWVVLIALAVFW
ncbi:decaprenyl-phosphate phosphoribosyltransferase [Auraticoccus sp. F435]|uniref:Decaprenyl-phosphate phosphoribosyltransferase n=1 Tax=Auraticoccus cholistanensis TaxID=2656650 RepID=A0A6A9UXU7_9ACTN|nr:decaprenyl-phosphate phosphoribosyltransferase [Auraticoccus cholistanensis]MVA76454.1 decaprenyl-phosphate phosphoribosyltransferase [Auraticoccus cholistanensis]